WATRSASTACCWSAVAGSAGTTSASSVSVPESVLTISSRGLFVAGSTWIVNGTLAPLIRTGTSVASTGTNSGDSCRRVSRTVGSTVSAVPSVHEIVTGTVTGAGACGSGWVAASGSP